MGGILGGIFGSGQRTTAEQRPDQTSIDFDKTKLREYNDFVGRGGGIGNFAGGGGGAYIQDPRTNQLWEQAQQDYYDTRGTGNITPFNMAYNMDYGGRDMRTDFGAGDINTAFNTQYGTGDVNTRFNQDFGAGNVSGNFDNAYRQDVAGLQNPNNQLMSLEDFRRNTSDTTSNYINRLATPQLKAQLAAQGMEGSGAMAEAIANATAQYGKDFAMAEPGLQQQNAQVRLGEAANVRSNAQAALQARQLQNEALAQANNAQLQRGQLLQLGNQAQQMGNEAAAQRAQMYAGENQARQMANEAVLGRGQLYSAENQARLNRGQLYGMENDARTAYNNAAAQQSMLPEQMRQMRAQTGLYGAQRAGTLFNISDQQRALQEQDLLRRQGLASGVYSGMPYNPGSYQSGRQSSQPLFNWFGQG